MKLWRTESLTLSSKCGRVKRCFTPNGGLLAEQHGVIPLLGVGVLAGVALSTFVSAWVRNLLYGVQPFDVGSDLAAMLLLAVIGIGATAVPAFRAMRVDPSSTLRQE